MAKLPYISSSVSIKRIEVWVLNKRSNYNDARNIVAFSDLGEHHHIFNPKVQPSGSVSVPYNKANTLYNDLIENYKDARNINRVGQTLEGFLEGGTDFVKMESAQRDRKSVV